VITPLFSQSIFLKLHKVGLHSETSLKEGFEDRSLEVCYGLDDFLTNSVEILRTENTSIETY